MANPFRRAAAPATRGMPACTIFVAKDRDSRNEIYHHEVAHCNGWVHADQNHGPEGPPKGYKAPKPPRRYLGKYKGPFKVNWLTTEEAIKECGSYGCAEGGLGRH